MNKNKVVRALVAVVLIFTLVAAYQVGSGFAPEFGQPRSSTPTGELTFAQYRAEQQRVGVVNNKVVASLRYVGTLAGITFNNVFVEQATRPTPSDQLRTQAEERAKTLTSM